ncbi:hypothetical protein OFB62_27705, partial [Escherichia coli]|nr:hypothetical protein [Escherichia coli]
ATHLVKEANKEHLLGRTAEEKALVQQWLEFRITRVDGHTTKKTPDSAEGSQLLSGRQSLPCRI